MNILIKDVPCYYELSWKNDPPTIVFRVHEDFIAETENISEDATIVNHYSDILELKSFSGDLVKSFGFEEGFLTKQDNEFVELHGILPKAKILHCGCDNPEDCFSCKGTGEKRAADMEKIWLLAVNINILLTLFDYKKVTTSSKLSQLLTVRTGINPKRSLHSSPIMGEFSKKLTNWLKTKPTDTEMLKVSEVMKAAQKHIWRLSEFNMVRAVLLHDYRYLTLNCDGDACGIHPTHSAHSTLKEENIGCEFTCHNLDNPIQQLTLLSGLAALHDQAREEMK